MIELENTERLSDVMSAEDACRVHGTSPLVPCPSCIVPRPSRASGFTYIGLLLFIAMMGTALAGTGVVFHRQSQREKEKELLFVGDQFRRAIGEYYQRSPGADKRFPKALEDLLLDARYPATQRYLRRIYRDPLTGSSEWGLVRRDDGSITGVYSLAEGEPAKRTHFPAAYASFEATTRYADWKFVYEATAQAESDEAPANATVPPGNSIVTRPYNQAPAPTPQSETPAQPR